MFLSVIIPNYNHALFLKQRIDSILNQKFDDYEIIILDDKSPDDSIDVINEFRDNKHISHIIVNEENSGNTFLQWEKGFKLAQGEYIWIAESDDFAHPDFLSTLIPLAKKHSDSSVLFCTSLFVDEYGRDLKWNNDFESKTIKIYKPKEFIKKRMLLGNAINNASSAIFKREALQSLDETYKTFKASGDWLFWVRIAEKGTVVEVKERLNYFRQHSNKVSPRSKSSGLSFYEMKRTYEILKLEKYLDLFHKYLVIGHRLFIINRFSDYESEQIQKDVKKLYQKEVLVPILAMYLYIFYRGVQIILSKGRRLVKV